MTSETRKRILVYKRLLPGMKEKVVATVAMLLIAAVCCVATSYAWVTLSVAPEVSSVETTLSANGALEIALAHGDGTELPSDADIDESISISSDVLVTNLTWGNLINISDSRYGIDDLTLRPAQLNTASLATRPLWGAEYTVDGRVEKLNTNYTYTKWDGNQFISSEEKGIRAIASFIIATSETSTAEYDSKYQAVLDAHTAVNAYYQSNVAVKSTMNSLGSCVSTYLQSKLNEKGYGNGGSSNIEMTTKKLNALLTVLKNLNGAYEKQKTAFIALANLQQYIYAKENDVVYEEIDWDTLVSNQNKFDSTGTNNFSGALSAVKIKGLKTFITDLGTVTADIQTMEALVTKSNSGEKVYSNDIESVVNTLCNGSACVIDGKTVSEWMNGSKTDMLSLADGDHLVKISGGILADFEQIAVDSSYRLKESTSDTNNSCSIVGYVSYSMFSANINMTGHLCTNATGNSYFMDIFGTIPSDISVGDKIAEDTYGMAIDFWVRCNQEFTYLTLEGATTVDTDGTILSYDGINRIWGATGNTALTIDSTTQGGGSCYIYYADTPEEMSRSLKLLESMKVAFVSQDGTLLAIADMDTEHYLAVTGRVTVPLVISTTESTSYSDKDDSGNETTAYAIQAMKLDESYLLTAVIYLDGATLTNDDVLAAADIQGQLNIQFGSSEKMQTVGDNKLLTAERKVTATVDKTKFNYDTAESEDDLTAKVTLEFDGTDPVETDSVTAFFTRAINSTQGQRGETITFTKQANGTWTADAVFSMPGTYYLRYIRLNRVDYALEDVPSVQVDGFGISSVTWGEDSDTVTVRTTEGSYTESVAIQFQSSDVDRMPTSVQAHFVRDDGTIVSIDTKYNVNTKKWEGSGSFVASGSYTLSYLVLSGSYYDISTYSKELTLYLGLTVAVYNNGSPLWEEYDSDNPKTYERNIQVEITDNIGNKLTDLENVNIYFANGSSIVNGAHTDLIWNKTTGYYEGTLSITKAGRYVFSKIDMNGDVSTKVSESPTYVVVPPDPPVYDTTSASTYHGSNIQFVPLKTTGTLGPIKISNSASASISAVVYNDVTGEYYDIVMSNNAGTSSGSMYYVADNNGYWMINLPTYSTDDSTENQDGTWSLIAIKLWDCFDGSSDADNLRTDARPLVWLAKTSQATAYKNDKNLSVDKYYDMSSLSTTVSNSVNVSMTSGTTALGNQDSAFMTQHAVKDIGMSVIITDDAGRNIPADKFGSDGKVELNVSYKGNTDAATYGYEVSTTASKDYSISFTQNDNGVWVPDSDSNYIWQYAGKYEVTSMSVTVAGKTKTFSAGENGVPTMYTITSKAPSASDLSVKSVTQTATVYGKTNDTVTGAFLAKYTPTVTAVLTWNTKDRDGKQYAMVPGISVEVQYDYQDGTTAPNGKYSWTGTTGYENYTDTSSTSVNNGSTYTFKVSGSHTLLAGAYSVTVYLKSTAGSTEIGDLSDISAYSISPSVTVTGISKEGNVTVNSTNSALTTDASTFTGVNRYGDHYAVVYMEYAVSTQEVECAGSCVGKYMDGNIVTETTTSGMYAYIFADYTVPEITLKSDNLCGYDATLTIANNGENSAVALSGGSKAVPIGYITTGTNTDYGHNYNSESSCTGGTTYTCNFPYATETPTILGGAQTITAVTTVSGSATYTRQLQDSLTISQTNLESPKLAIASVAGLTISVKDSDNLGVTNGSMVDGFTSLTITATANQGYYNPRVTAPANAIDWVVVSEGEESATYTCKMAFENMSLGGTVSKYNTVTYAGNDKADISVSAGGTSIPTGVGVKPGTTVTVTLSAKDNYYSPATTASGATLNKTSSTDYSTVYTFTMPKADVTLSAITANLMKTVSWENTSAFSFTAVDVTESSKTVTSGMYVVPGHKVRVTIKADGGTDPALTSPSSATLYASSDAFTRQYDFTMPDSNVTLAGTATPYPNVTYGNSYASVTMKSNGASVSTEGADAKGIKPGNIVTITLTAKAGYYAPRMTQPTGVSNFKEVGTSNNQTATYTFTMPNVAVDVVSVITATAAPTVTFAGGNATLSVAGSNYDGSAIATTSGTQVQPGQTVTVTVTASGEYFNPVVSASGATLSGRTAVGNGYDKATYTFTMGTTNVTLTTSATAYPTLTINNSNTTITANVGGSAKTATLKVKPGTNVSITVAAATNYYDAKVTVSGGATTTSFNMPTSDVTATGTATIKPKITIKNSNTKITVTADGKSVSSGGYVTPGVAVQVSAAASSSSYKDAKVAASGGVTLSSASSLSFTMPTSDVTLTGSATKNSSGCVASGTLITMADGSKKPIEELTTDDVVLAFNHETGTIVAAQVNFIEADGIDNYNVITLEWSNGTTSRIISEHGFFDLDEMKYVYLHEEDCQQFIGHRFYVGIYDGSTYTAGEVTLVNAYVTCEYTGCFEFPSKYHLNFFMEDMLSMPGGIEGIFNIFEYGSDLRYDQVKMEEDIATYGLFDYDNVAEYMSYETFCTYPSQYVNVSIGKGVMTEDGLMYLIERYASRYDIADSVD